MDSALARENRKLRQQNIALQHALTLRAQDYDPLAESLLVKQAVRVAVLKGIQEARP